MTSAAIDPARLPSHVAIVMDGNGRWANQRGKARIFGHRNALEAVRDTTETAARLGIKNLTLYAFSTENWKRPKTEVSALMNLLFTSIGREVKTLMENDIRLMAIGDIESLPATTRRGLKKAMAETAGNKRMNLILALSYSSKWELTEAVKQIAAKAASGELQPSQIDDATIDQHLCTTGIPDPEIMIRTSGEKRISNFLMWQLAYAELFFLDKLWPDFRGADLEEVVRQFQQRERRFGMTTAQVKAAQ